MGRPRGWNDEAIYRRWREWDDLYRSGVPVATIAEMYQVSESAIYHAFHGLGTLARFQGQPGRELPARWHTYARRYQAGQSVARIAKEFGVSTSVVHHALRRMGVAMRPKRPPVKLTAEEVMQLLKVRDEEGLNGTELGTRFGISQEYACRILRGKARRDISRTEDLA